MIQHNTEISHTELNGRLAIKTIWTAIVAETNVSTEQKNITCIYTLSFLQNQMIHTDGNDVLKIQRHVMKFSEDCET